MKIYTKTGDQGETSLFGGRRVLKCDIKVETYGTIDELNAFVGVSKSLLSDENLIHQLAKIQFDLFTIGSESATPVDQLFLANGKNRLTMMISEKEIRELEEWIDEMEKELEPLQYFILPGGGKTATSLHVARTVCRRAERSMIALQEIENIRPELLQYLNRLSDYFFVLSRYVSKKEGEKEEYWIPR